MPDFTAQLPDEDWLNAGANTEFTEAASFVMATRPYVAKSSMLGSGRAKHLVAFMTSFLIVPHIDSMVASSAPAGSPTTTVDVFGGFNDTDTVYWNGIPLTTTFVSTIQVQISVLNTLLVGPYSGAIAAANIGGAWSNSLAFSVLGGSGRPIIRCGII